MADAGKKRILWLHTQPEHYFNCMMDDLARGTGYRVPAMPETNPEGAFEYIAAFSFRGPGLYTDYAQPIAAQTCFLRALPGKESRPPSFREKYHVDWRADLLPLKFDAAIVSGYASRTHREVIADCRRRGIPVAMWSDSNLRSQRGRGLKARLKRRLKKSWLAKIIADTGLMLTTNSLGIAYWRYYGVPRNRITLCPYYSDYHRIDAARRRDRAEVLSSIGLAASDRLLFSAARLVEAKGLDIMIHAFVSSGLHERGWRYVIAGAGPLESALKLLAASQLNKSIFFIGFQQPAENLALMAHAETLALPSRYEPHGIVVGEALAAGTPVLASDVVGAAHDLVTPRANGLIFRADNVNDLIGKLKLLEDEAALRRMKSAARPSFEIWYRGTTPTIVVPRVLRQLLGERGMRGGGP